MARQAVHWLLQDQGDLPSSDAWLSAGEQAVLSGLRATKRRADWLLGRWAAKRALLGWITTNPVLRTAARPADLELCVGETGAPKALLGGQPLPVALSISHSGSFGMCALSAPSIGLGCDLERVEKRSRAFVADYLTAAERALVARRPVGEQPTVETLLWSAKESALKAMRAGQGLDTRMVCIEPSREVVAERDWQPLRARRREAADSILHGWGLRRADYILTVVATRPLARPALIE